MGLLSLPLELLLRVADWLQPEDVFHLSQASKDFAHLIRYGLLCKRVLLVRKPMEHTYQQPLPATPLLSQ